MLIEIVRGNIMGQQIEITLDVDTSHTSSESNRDEQRNNTNGETGKKKEEEHTRETNCYKTGK